MSDNAALLDALLPSAARVRHNDPEKTVPRALSNAIVRFVCSDLLIAVRDGGIARLPSVRGGVIITATDQEAADAYIARSEPGTLAKELRFVPVSELVGGKPTLQFWVNEINRTKLAWIALNPVGPLGVMFNPKVIQQTKIPFLNLRPRHVENPWRDNSQRGPARQHAIDVLDDYTAALRAEDHEKLSQIRDTTGVDSNRVGDLAVDGQMRHFTGQRMLLDDEDRPHAIKQLVTGAYRMAACGFPEVCIDLILSVRDELFKDVPSADNPPPWAANQLGAAGDALDNIDLDWRRAETKDFIEAANRVLPVKI